MIRALVLCGGESKRMGQDKGLLSLGSDNWAKHAVRKLEQLNIPVNISINPTQLSKYGRFFSAEQLIKDKTKAQGPLNGILSSHLKHPGDDLLLLACDVIEMDVELLKLLRNSFTTFPGYDYYVFAHEDFMEPLCAIYPSASLKKIYKELEDGNLSGFSLHKLIKKGNYKALPITNMQTFSNHNTATLHR